MKTLIKLTVIFLFCMSVEAKTVEDSRGTMRIETADNIDLDVITALKQINPYAKIAISDDASEAFVTAQYSATGGNSLEILHNSRMLSFKSEVLEDNLTTFLDVPAYRTVTIVTINNMKMKYIMVDFIKGDKYYFIMAWTFESSFNKYVKSFDKIIASFHLL